MKQNRIMYVLMNRERITFLSPLTEDEFKVRYPFERYSIISCETYGSTRNYIETKSLKAGMIYGNKAAAEFILNKYNKHTHHTASPDFHVAKVKITYEI